MPDIDEDIMRELMIQSTADLFARSAPTAEALRRRRQRQLRTRVLGVTGIAAAAGLAVGTLAIPSGAGLGVELDEDQVAGYHEAFKRGVVQHRDDTAELIKRDPGWLPMKPRW